jgi:hypothetical protein
MMHMTKSISFNFAKPVLITILCLSGIGCKVLLLNKKKSDFSMVSKIICKAHRDNYTMSPNGCKYFDKIRQDIGRQFSFDTIEVKKMSIIESHDIVTGTSYIMLIINGIETNYSYKGGVATYDESSHFPEEIIKNLRDGIISCNTNCKVEIYKNEKIYIGSYLKKGHDRVVNTMCCFLDSYILK